MDAGQKVGQEETDTTRRDMLGLTSATLGTTILGAAGLGLVATFRPSDETKKGQVVERTLAGLERGQQVEVRNLQGQLYYIRRRTDDEIRLSEAWTLEKMEAAGTGPRGFKDVELDSDRVQDPQYLVVEARCTHLGCAPVEQDVELKLARDTDQQGIEAGYFCPCHGSIYDLSGRVRVGPAVLNLVVPAYVINRDDAGAVVSITIGKAA